MDNCISSTKALLKYLDVKYTQNYVKDNLFSHPEHPSLLCIADTLDKYNINSLAVKINKEKLDELPLPCVVQVTKEGQPFFYVLKKTSTDTVTFLNEDNKVEKVAKENFSKLWTGVCLLVEKTEKSGEKDIAEKIKVRNFKNSLLVLALLLFAFWSFHSFFFSERYNSAYPSIPFSSIAYFVLKLLGLGVSSILLWYEVDKYNPTLQSFCSGGKKVNCEAVLSSKYSTILGGNISIGIIAFSYFFGSLLYLLTTSFATPSIAFLGYLSFAGLPVVILSAYSQAFILKKWCKFCLAVQGVLLLEIATVIFGGFYLQPIAMDTVPLFLLFFFIPILGWMQVKPLLEKQKETNLYKRGLKKIKNNPNVLEGLLSKSRKISKSTEGLGISITSPTAKYHVIKACNPYCGPCAKAHPHLEELVNKGSINLQILFTASENDFRAKPVKHFLAIDAKGDQKKTQEALDTWYNAEEKDYEIFSEIYPMNGELKMQTDKIKAMFNWCQQEKITHTPTIFVNGYELPKEYSVEDLKEVLG